ncbi:peptidylprolyl isomerase [Oceanobacillus indicireducens]|uniref:Foldase protein PrsA n=1 Tax=Oceanobacillus indicireducens TaxID=1004261 RepID=A0A917Y0S6_9BACI|nr:peptidylprolyl isomerase [Oceanobacillus indicireducens]GGN60012.1 foldase protein PrsA 1 [Oceanobacillus indicireducens]
MKKYFFGLILCIAMLTACQQEETQGVVIETSYGDITEEVLNEALQERYGKQVLEELVMIQVLGEKYDVSEEQVTDELEKLKENYGIQFDQMIQQQGFADEEAFKDVIYLGLLQEEAALDEVVITDEQLEEAYEQKTKEISAQHILVQNKDIAEEVLEQIEQGADFAELAKEYSEDAMTAEEGGELGYFSAGTMVPPFENVAFSLEKGDISDPVQTTYGYHIIKVNDIQKKDQEIGTFDEVKEELRDEILKNSISTVETQVKIEQMIQDSIVDIKNESYEGLFDSFQEVTGASR